uniref:PH01B019A14.8 protein n=1 Tax=Phyllostachys edulis TaxID=38705 RepID=L0P1N1_PHYED|nr:PH01B019A14.8 [Phyllostachys edulis]
MTWHEWRTNSWSGCGDWVEAMLVMWTPELKETMAFPMTLCTREEIKMREREGTKASSKVKAAAVEVHVKIDVGDGCHGDGGGGASSSSMLPPPQAESPCRHWLVMSVGDML